MIRGLVNNVRQSRYIGRKYIQEDIYNDKYKVLVPYSSGNGFFGEMLSSPIIAEPNSGFTQSYIGFGNFDSKLEAEFLKKYIQTKFARGLLSVLKVTQHNNKNTWKKVPNQSFTSESDIDWSRSISDIDQQLYKKYCLTEDEIEFIEKNVQAMD